MTGTDGMIETSFRAKNPLASRPPIIARNPKANRPTVARPNCRQPGCDWGLRPCSTCRQRPPLQLRPLLRPCRSKPTDARGWRAIRDHNSVASIDNARSSRSQVRTPGPRRVWRMNIKRTLNGIGLSGRALRPRYVALSVGKTALTRRRSRDAGRTIGRQAAKPPA